MTDYVSGIDAIYNYHLPTMLQVTVKMPANENGNSVFYTNVFSYDTDKYDVYNDHIVTGNFLAWTSYTIAAQNQPTPAE